MNTTKQQLKENSLEVNVLDPMSQLKCYPMSKPESEMMITILMSPESHEKMYEDIKEKSWILKAFEKRIKHCLTIEIDIAIQIFLLFKIDGKIGSGMLYLYYIQYWAKQEGLKKITFEDFGMRMFPNGYPSVWDMDQIWDMQKLDTGGNMIDNPNYSKSIQY